MDTRRAMLEVLSLKDMIHSKMDIMIDRIEIITFHDVL